VLSEEIIGLSGFSKDASQIEASYWNRITFNAAVPKMEPKAWLPERRSSHILSARTVRD
jgi:hypothetical protein